MPLSRLRLRLTGWFGGAFLVGLAILSIVLFVFLRHREDRELTARLHETLGAVAEAIRREDAEPDTPDLASAVRDALREYPARDMALAVYGPDGQRLESGGPIRLLAGMPDWATLPAAGAERDLPLDGEGHLRVASGTARVGEAILTIAAAASTAPLREEAETLAAWMLVSAPLMLLLALAGGYFLSARALAPIADLGRRVAGLPADDLEARLPVLLPADEVGRLADQFNGLLQRIGALQERNRRFLAEAAHQLRTPLTLVLGESELALERERAPAEQRETLRRIRTAARQMMHRVNELFLLASAEAGERVPAAERIDLDGLVLDVVDLFRARARQLDRRLELGTMGGVDVMGSGELLREAVLELLENAGRHGGSPVRISVQRLGADARVTVENPGPPLAEVPEAAPAGRNGGLGLPILHGIARVHGGALRYEHMAGSNRFTLELPAA